MKSAICTLFEGHYHYGVAALSNSLYQYGFSGTIYVGYRGALPAWVLKGKKTNIDTWQEAIVLNPAKDLELCFLQLDTNYSLTNYKPDFMTALWDGPAKDCEALFYFDPDIILNDSWACYQNWVACGVALCEDVNSPMPELHPRRVGWRNYFKKYTLDLKYKNPIYVNGGFVGLTKNNRAFLALWIKMQECMADGIGGLENSIFSNQTYNSSIPLLEGFQIFDKSDQDALNATIEVFEGPISFIGSESMGFKPGHSLMYHALGSPKPWGNKLILRALNGRVPRIVDDAFWKIKQEPILVHSKARIIRKKASMYLAKLIGRFYST